MTTTKTTGWNAPVRRVAAVTAAAMFAVVACTDQEVTAPGEHAETRGPQQGFPAWSEQSSGVTMTLQDVWGADHNNVIAVGNSSGRGGDAAITHFDGSAWTPRKAGTEQNLFAVWGSSPDDVWAVGGLGAVTHFDGDEWTFQGEFRDDIGWRRLLTTVWGTGPDDIWAAGSNGTAYRFDGAGWTFVKLPTSRTVRHIWGIASDDVFAVGDGGLILHFDGSGWSEMDSPTGTRLNAVGGSAHTGIFAAGSFGAILRFDGEQWSEDSQSREITSEHIRDIWGNQQHDVFAVAWNGTILRHDGDSWHAMQSRNPLRIEGIWGSRGNHLFAVGQFGTVLRGGRGAGTGHAPVRDQPEAIWPLSASALEDADSVHAQYGPRALPSGYDFHAGLDIIAPQGTPVHAVQDGIVAETREWDGVTRGAGNAVLVHHANNRSTSYLHLHTIDVEEGDSLRQGEVLGTVGSTGATYNHLHLGYFVDLPGDRVDERRSRNPLELLPHNRPETTGASFVGDATVELDVSLPRMTIRSVTLIGEGEERTVDFYDVVARGFTPRKEQVQFEVFLDAGRAREGRFDLTLRPEPRDFTPNRVVVTDIHGDVILDERR